MIVFLIYKKKTYHLVSRFNDIPRKVSSSFEGIFTPNSQQPIRAKQGYQEENNSESNYSDNANRIRPGLFDSHFSIIATTSTDETPSITLSYSIDNVDG